MLDSKEARELRKVISKLVALGYTENVVAGHLGLEDLSDLQWRHLPIYRSERLKDRNPLALAIELYLLQGALETDELDLLFNGSERDLLIRTGLLAIDEAGRTRACASLFPVGDRLIFSDHAWPELPHPGYTAVPCDQVMAVGSDSRHLARCTVRRPFRTALDLCAGSGIQALLASAHSEHVFAVDINPREERCTRFNAQASTIDNLEVMVGDLFDPVPDRRFDLITANPPFVPSPLENLWFRDGGRSGEDVQKRIVAGLPHYLAPGGIAQMVTELGERDGEPLAHRLRQWLDGAAMDIYILRLGEYSAAQYAIGHAKGNDFEAFLNSTHEWTNNLRAQGYCRIVSVVVSLQWSDTTCGSSWERIDTSPPPRRSAGNEIEGLFCAERLARSLDDQKLIEQGRLHRRGPTALLEARVMGGDVPANYRATRLGRSLQIEHQLGTIEREMLVRMNINGDGSASVKDLIDTFCDLGFDQASVVAAIHSLLRGQFVGIDAT